MGETIAIGPQDGAGALAVGVSWDAPGIEIDVCALALAGGRVPGDDWFVFFNNRQSPKHDLILLQPAAGRAGITDLAQVLVGLADLDASVDKVVIAAATLASDDLSGVRNLTIRVLDLLSAEVLVSFDCPGIYSEACVVLVECYRHGSDWKVRALGSGYPSLAQLVTSHGVNLAQ